jgi:hypothetical protein
MFSVMRSDTPHPQHTAAACGTVSPRYYRIMKDYKKCPERVALVVR